MSDLPRPRSYQQISGALDACLQHRTMLWKVLAGFYAVDTRPLVWDGETVTRVGELALPPDLLQMLKETNEEIALLQVELRDAYYRFVYPERH